jgi:hypothetical protein
MPAALDPWDGGYRAGRNNWKIGLARMALDPNGAELTRYFFAIKRLRAALRGS